MKTQGSSGAACILAAEAHLEFHKTTKMVHLPARRLPHLGHIDHWGPFRELLEFQVSDADQDFGRLPVRAKMLLIIDMSKLISGQWKLLTC